MIRKRWLILGLILGLGWLTTRFLSLDRLPVFADEAIYIRWAQMIANDPKQYLFIPLYDGKTPLQMWLLTLFLAINYAEPVVMGRIFSILSGGLTMLILVLITRHLGGKRTAMLTTIGLYILLPYTFLHDRLALIDVLYVMFLAATVLSLLYLKEQANLKRTLIAGLFFGLALLTKLPGLTFLLQFLLILWLMPPQLPEKRQQQTAKYFGIAALMGLGMLYLLRVSELFPFLFSRGADFTFTAREILAGQGTRWLYNLSQWGRWQMAYSTLGLWLLISAPFWFKTGRRSQTSKLAGKLVLMAILMGIYFLIFGKIVYSRYYLPMMVFLIPAGAISSEWLWQQGKKKLLIALLVVILGQSLRFMTPFFTDITKVRLEKSDREQYLTEWSAGFGNREIALFLKTQALKQPLAVATEGFFGTLPDGLSIYFDHSPLNDRVKIFGIGQPVTRLTEEVRKAAQERETYLVVNQNRLKMELSDCCELVSVYPRPYGGAPLLLIKVKP